jgi:hypothetical protein
MVRVLPILCAVVVAVMVRAATSASAKEMPVPALCTPEINAVLADLVAGHGPDQAYNIMVCGIVTEDTTLGQAVDRTPSHHQTIVAAPVANGPPLFIKIITNDRRDGVVRAKKGDHVEAFGWYFKAAGWERPAVGVINNTFCAIHGDLYNGWVVVNGIRWPRAGCGAGSSLP